MKKLFVGVGTFLAASLFISALSESPVSGSLLMESAPAAMLPNNSEVRATLSNSSYYIIIDKSDYELKVYDAEGWYATYPIVFGSKDQGDKLYEGDKRTPNGKYKIIVKKINPRWGAQMTLDYPTPSNVQLFNQRKAQGIIPKTAHIGNGIAIHSTRKDEEWTVDNFYNWTDGCISLKYSEMQDLFSYIPVGTEVTIQP